MPHYRCYCVDGGDHIRAVNVFDCDSDDEARAKGAALLSACRHSAAEIWDGGRRVARIDGAGAGGCCCAAAEQAPAALRAGPDPAG